MDLLNESHYFNADENDLFRVILFENPSTGYKWLINHKKDIANPIVEVVYDRYKAPMGDAVGAPGVRYVTMRVKEKAFF
jgi:predicted secreted protein